MKGLLVGFGSIGRRHLANLHSLGVTDWAVVHTGLGTLPLEPPCRVRVYRSVVQALENEVPTFAVIANPTSLHLQTALACVNAGCSILLEKPLSHSLDGVAELEAEIAARRTRVLMGFQFRFDPALKRIRDLLATGAIGAPLHARVIWAEHLPAWHPWEDWRGSYAARADLGGGVHHTICHPIDYLRMLLGDPKSVQAHLTADGPLGLAVPEAADVLLRFGDRTTVQLHLDYWGRPPIHRLEMTCTGGRLEWDYITGQLRIWDECNGAWELEDYPGVDDRNDLFLAEARHLLDMVAGRAEPCSTVSDGIAVVKLCETITRSAESGCAMSPNAQVAT